MNLNMDLALGPKWLARLPPNKSKKPQLLQHIANASRANLDFPSSSPHRPSPSLLRPAHLDQPCSRPRRACRPLNPPAARRCATRAAAAASSRRRSAAPSSGAGSRPTSSSPPSTDTSPPRRSTGPPLHTAPRSTGPRGARGSPADRRRWIPAMFWYGAWRDGFAAD
jgi:hypothetical protein